MDLSSHPSEPSALRQRIRDEYDEQPSLRLTPAQAQRLFSSGPQETAACLAQLVADGELQRLPDGHFVRRRLSNVIPIASAAGSRWWIRARYRRFQSAVHSRA